MYVRVGSFARCTGLVTDRRVGNDIGFSCSQLSLVNCVFTAIEKKNITKADNIKFTKIALAGFFLFSPGNAFPSGTK